VANPPGIDDLRLGVFAEEQRATEEAQTVPSVKELSAVGVEALTGVIENKVQVEEKLVRALSEKFREVRDVGRPQIQHRDVLMFSVRVDNDRVNAGVCVFGARIKPAGQLRLDLEAEKRLGGDGSIETTFGIALGVLILSETEDVVRVGLGDRLNGAMEWMVSLHCGSSVKGLIVGDLKRVPEGVQSPSGVCRLEIDLKILNGGVTVVGVDQAFPWFVREGAAHTKSGSGGFAQNPDYLALTHPLL
jgi:hypothetical protein